MINYTLEDNLKKFTILRSMTVSPCRRSLFVEYKDLYQFLLGVQQNCLKNHCRQIVSISLKIDWVDPLAVLDKLSQANAINFYFENRSKGEAIAGIDAVTKLQINGQERFDKAEYFIKSNLENIVNFGNHKQPFAGPHFFCYFSFFAENNQIDYPFPSATVFLPRWQISVKNQCCTLVMNTVINSSLNIEILLESLRNKIEVINSLKPYSPNLDYFLLT